MTDYTTEKWVAEWLSMQMIGQKSWCDVTVLEQQMQCKWLLIC